MPELPEVETVRRGLEPVMTGRTIVRADVNRPDLRWPLPPNLGRALEGATVRTIGRRSKYLLFELDTGRTLIVHLGMSGRMLIDRGAREGTARFLHAHRAADRHDHVVLHLDDGTAIVFNDPRRFGAIDLAASADVGAHRLLAGLGPEPLGNAFSGEVLERAFAGRRAPVRALLLDQRVVAGLGNIYVAEALWRAGISPFRQAGRIARVRVDALVAAIRDTLADAIDAGGSSLRDFRHADGELGYFQHSFAAYGRDGAPCQKQNCNGTIVRRSLSGRSSFHCTRCQR